MKLLMVAAAAAGSLLTGAQSDDVMGAYHAYMAAIEADDLAAAAGHAQEAYRLGRAEGVDAGTLAALAENRAQVLEDLGRMAEAAAAYEDLAGIEAESGADAARAAELRLRAAGAWRAAGDERNAREQAGQAVFHAGGLPAGSALAFQSHALLAQLEWDRGRLRQAGDSAKAAVETLHHREPAYASSPALMAFMAGIGGLMRRDNPDAAYHFSLASAIGRRLEAETGEDDSASVLYGWAIFARSVLSEAEGLALLERMAASPYQAALLEDCDSADENGPPTEYEGRDWRDTVRLRNTPPAYPHEGLRRGLNGVALYVFDVNEQGRTTNIRTLASIPHPMFGPPGEEAIRQWRYDPATVDGQPVEKRDVFTSFNFMIDNR